MKEKEPITESDFENILSVVERIPICNNKDARKLVLLLKYTGMHISVIINPRLKLEERKIDKKIFLTWYRPKKKRDSKDSKIIMQKSKHINFNVEKFAKDIQGRKRKKTRQYLYNVIKEIGVRAKIKDLSPNSFRHTFGIFLLDNGASESFVQQQMGCSHKTVKTYVKYSTKRTGDFYDRIDW